jgi:TRAP-type mannitol/chloroaromatic compound transport system permease small subunit
MHRSLQTAVRRIEQLSEWSGAVISWCVLLIALVVGYNVSMRFFFQIGSVALQELEWHLFALMFLLGASYTLKHDGHVRVDIFYQSKKLTDSHRAWIDLSGTLFFLFPFCLLIIFTSWDFMANAYVISEGSPDPGGLPYRFLLKAAIPLGFALLMIQGAAIILKSIDTIFFLSKTQIQAESRDK